MRAPLLRFLAAIVVGLSVVAAMWILAGAIVRSRGADDVVRVTGSARKPIRSDFIIWSGRVAYRAATQREAYASVRSGVQQVTRYLTSKGIKPEEIQTNAITTSPVYGTVRTPTGGGGTTESQQLQGYDLSQTVEVRSSDVERVGRVSREVTDLLATGVAFESNAPQYLYTKISEEKVAILGEAAKDARRRAEEIARNSSATLGEVRFARMSPLQITPLYSTEVTYDGQNDTTSLDKAITAIVTMGFAVR